MLIIITVKTNILLKIFIFYQINLDFRNNINFDFKHEQYVNYTHAWSNKGGRLFTGTANATALYLALVNDPTGSQDSMLEFILRIVFYASTIQVNTNIRSHAPFFGVQV